VHPFFNGDRAGEAARVVEIVAQARREDAEGTIAILVRNRGHLHEIVPQLKSAGLCFRAIEIEELCHRPVVQDLLALTRALSHPADRLAWLALLRAPWCGLTLADLNALAGSGAKRTVWELMSDEACVMALSADGCARLERVRAVLQACLDHRCRGSLRARVAGAWFALSGPACVEDMTDLEDAEIYFDYLESHEEAGEIADPAAFEDELADLYALPDLKADDRLQVMTLHKAKGLEFDTVIVPGLGRAPRGDDRKLFLWMEQPRKDGDGAAELLLAPIHATGADDDPIYRWLQHLETEKEGLESGRCSTAATARDAPAPAHMRLATDDDRVPLRPGQEHCSIRSGRWSIRCAAARAVGCTTCGREDGAQASINHCADAWSRSAAASRVAGCTPSQRAREQIEFSGWETGTRRQHRAPLRNAEDGFEGDAARIRACGTFADQLRPRPLGRRHKEG
jgi:hypothetical protein